MRAFVVEDGVAVPFDQADVDTDQILPARFLRRPRQGGYGTFLFRDVRFNDDDSERPDFILNQLPFRNATIMVADRNFGCGSSREQAPWGLVDHGIRCVIAADFGDIFYLNSIKTGLLPVQTNSQKIISNNQALKKIKRVFFSVEYKVPQKTVIC